MAGVTKTGQTLGERLAAAGPFDERSVFVILRQLAEQVSANHQAGRLHRAIFADQVRIDGDDRVTLAPVSESAREVADWPPELAGQSLPPLPAKIAAVQNEFRAAGLAVPPRRIDIYQLGCLACELLTGRGPQSYLFSPKAKAKISPDWRWLVDQLLGHEPGARIETCDELQAELQVLATSQLTGPHAETPPVGTRADVGNTPVNLEVASGGSMNLSMGGSDAALPFAALGHYRVVSRLGSGGMGDVYLGFDPTLDRSVAIKVLPAELARQQDFVQRFTEEAKAAARLVHPNIVQIYFIGADQGHHYFAMQYVPGESLAAKLAREKSLAADEALRILEQVVSGLAVAHRRGMIHRDIKPGNILLDADHDRALLADFGLVKSLGSSAQMTATGMVMGTVDYISPEQGRGQKVDGRSDLYSIGVLLYQMTSGRLPFTAESATAMIFQHAYERPLPLDVAAPQVPRDIAKLVHRLLEKDPADRYQTADDLIADIGRLRRGEPLEWSGTLDGASGATSVVIKAPDFEASEEERRVTTMLPDIRPISWREKLRAAFHEHAPEAVRNLQNTGQQIDGALAVYEKRRNELAQLAHEARQVEKQLQEQVAAHKKAAAAETSREVRLHHETAAAELEAQLHQQRDEIGEIQLHLAKIDATLSKLKSQRAILRARLRTAEAEKRVGAAADELSRHRPLFMRLPVIAASVTAAVFIFALATRFINFGRKPSPSPAPTNVVSLDRSLQTSSPAVDATPLEVLTSDEWEWSDVESAGPIINSPAQDTAPHLSSDGQTLIFGSRRPGGLGNHDLWMAARNSTHGEWSQPVNLGPNTNSASVDVSSAMTADALTLVFNSDRPGGQGGSDLYVSSRPSVNQPWSTPVNLGPRINSGQRDNAPFISPDGLTLAWSSGRSGGLGAIDLWMSTRRAVDDAWGNPQNLGPAINSSEDDWAPRLSSDGLVLMFNAARAGGPGGQDLWMATRTSTNASFGAPIRLPAPINSPSDDSNVSLSMDGTMLWFSSDRPGAEGNGDLFFVRRVRKASPGPAPTPLEILTSDDWEWTAPVNAGPTVNASGDDNAPFLSANRISLYFRSIRSGGLGGADIWVARRPGVRQPWMPPVNAGPTVNSSAAEGRPSMTADGLLLVVFSSRAGGSGARDLYTSSRATTDAPWGELVNMGPPINTNRDESGPQISSDGLTLLFASNRAGGLGQSDFWMATRASVDQPWGEPVHLGAVNSPQEDFSATLSADQLALIYSSNRPGGSGGRDLYIATRASRDRPFGAGVNLGPIINSAEHDDGPYLFDDASRLWFDSRRPGGYGGADMWVTRRVRKQAQPSIEPDSTKIVSASVPAAPSVAPVTALTSSGWRWGEVTSAGPVLNSTAFDATPFISPDGRTLLFGSMRRGGQGNLDIWMATRASENDPWDPPVNLGPNINSREWDGSPTMTADGLTLLFESHRPGGRGDVEIYVSTRQSFDQPWPPAVSIGEPIATNQLDNAPHISPDGLTLAFSAIRDGGVGFVDLWMSQRASLIDAWGTPFNAGLRVNSTVEDWAPRLSSDGLVLIFQSRRAGGPGAYDLWIATRRSTDEAFGRPVALPSPINSEFDEQAASLSFDGQTLWFSSKRPGGEGDSDLYFVRRVKGDAARTQTVVEQEATGESIIGILTSEDWEWGEVTNTGPEINSSEVDETPFVSADGLTLLYKSARSGGLGRIDLWMASRKSVDEPWGKPVNMGPGINTEHWEGSPSMTADGLLLVFDSQRTGNTSNGEVYYSTRNSASEPWGPVMKLEYPISTGAMENGSFISPDGLTFAYASARGGGGRAHDVFIARRNNRTDSWPEPVNAGLDINSPLEEQAPRLSADGRVLIFTTVRDGGSGGLDLWMATRSSPNEPFGSPVPLPPGINSEHVDRDGFLSADGKTLWFSSNRPGGYGRHDLYYVRRVRKPRAGQTAQLPAADASGLFGNMVVGNRISKHAFHYHLGRILPNSLISEQILAMGDGNLLDGRLPNSRSSDPTSAGAYSTSAVKITLAGQLEVPRNMVVQAMHNGGSPTNGVHTLSVDGREVGQIGDDRYKAIVYRLPMEAGTHDIEWELTGGHFGDSVLQFFDPETKQPLRVVIGESALAAARRDPIESVVSNEDYVIAGAPREIGQLKPLVFPEGPPQLPAADATGLFGMMTVDEEPTRVAFHYTPGKLLPHDVLAELVFALGHSRRNVKIKLAGQLEVPRKMTVQAMDHGGSANRGIHWLSVDGKEVGSSGDDRVKNPVYNVELDAGTHAVEWVIAGGDFGDSVLQFFDPATKLPLPVKVGEAALAAASGERIDSVLSNDQYDTAAIPKEIGEQK
jgi:serine/threonine protein kinase/Tol biopolymer transport system component